MKFAHLADTHLGYRQFGLNDRETDLYEVFDKIIDKIIEEDVDFVIHSGDLFETARPSPNALLAFQKGLLRLKGAGIQMYSIAGNHDSIMRKTAIPPQVLFKKFGLKVISPINTNYLHGDVFIAGLPYFPSSQDKNLKNKLANLSKKAENHLKSILVLHQGIDKYLPFHSELEIGDLPDNFDYYALGHVHNYIEDDFGKGKLVYPGSIDILKSDEYGDYVKNGKGFVVVDLDGDKPKVKRVPINISREFVNKTIDYNNLSNELKSLKIIIDGLKKKPIVNLTINNVDGSIRDIYDMIDNEISDYALMIRPDFKFVDEEVDLEILNKSNILGPKELLTEELKDFDDENIVKLGLDLYELLSNNKNDDALKLAYDFYENNYESLENKSSANKTDNKEKTESKPETPNNDDGDSNKKLEIEFKEAI